MRIQVPRYAKPSPKLEVLLEADGPLQDDYQMKIALDRTGERTRFREEIDLPGLRQQKATLSVSPGKNFVCQANVNDWRRQFYTADVFSDVWFRVNVWRKNPDTKEYEKVKVAYPPGLPAPWRPSNRTMAA